MELAVGKEGIGVGLGQAGPRKVSVAEKLCLSATEKSNFFPTFENQFSPPFLARSAAKRYCKLRSLREECDFDIADT